MVVAVVDVRVVRVAVQQALVPVRMRVRFRSVPVEIVPMAVMLVVRVAVRVLQRFVPVLVRVALR